MEILAILAIFGAISAAIASSRGSSAFGYFFVGVMLGPIGIVLALTTGVKCPRCMRRIHMEAAVCPHCMNERTEELAAKKAADVQVAVSKQKTNEMIEKLNKASAAYNLPWIIFGIIFCVIVIVVHMFL